MCYKENKSLFFWQHENLSNVAFKSLPFSIVTDSFLVEKWGTLERVMGYVCKNLLNLECHDSIHFGNFQVA